MTKTVFDVHDGPGPDAETVLLSSGLGGAAGYWTPQLDALRQRYRVVAYDQAGTGRTGGELAADHSIAAMADEAAAVLDASGRRRPTSSATRWAASWAWRWRNAGPIACARSPSSTAGPPSHSHTRRCFDVRLALLKHEGPAAYVRSQPIFLFPADWLAQNEARVAQEEAHGLAGFQGVSNLHARIGALLAFDARPGLANLKLPTFIVAARDDILVPSVMSEELAAAIPGARLHVAPWGAHALNVTEPAAFNTLLLDFLSCVPAKA